MNEKRLTLFRLTWSQQGGTHWLPIKNVHHSMADLAVPLAEADDPGATYIVAIKAPAITPADESRARHVANAF